MRVRVARSVFPIVEECRAALGIRRGVHAGGVYYKELAPERLLRALSKRGTGHKDYRVTFPDGSKQIIRCSHTRCFCDLMGFEGHHRYSRLVEDVRPGDRILEIVGPPYATGYTSDHLARATGESGGVVAFLGDPQGALFAASRYRGANLSMEVCPPPPQTALDGLIGETDGAFDVIVCVHAPVEDSVLPEFARGLWRVLRPGGWMVIGVPRGKAESLAKAVDVIRTEFAAEATLISDPDEPGGTSDAMILKPRPTHPAPPPSSSRRR